MKLEDLFKPAAESISAEEQEKMDLFLQYQQMFGSAVPTEMIPSDITDEKLTEAVRKCIETGKNTLLSDLGVEIVQGRVY